MKISIIFNSILLVFCILFLFFVFVPVHKVEAATVTWNGGGADNNWSTGANWSTGTPPTSTDAVVFDGTSTKNATIDSSFAGSVASLTINSGYTGTITQSQSLTIASGDFTQAAGTFTGGAFTITITGNFNISGGTFTGPSGQSLSITGNFNQSGGTWNAGSNGKIQFNGSTNSTVTLTTNNFGQFTINKSSSAQTVTFSNSFSVTGSFNITQGQLANPASSVTTSIGGNFVQSANTTTGGNNLTLNFNPTSNRTVTLSSGSIASLIQIAPSAGKSVSLATNFSTTGAGANCTVSSGIFALAGFNFTCGGTFNVQNGTTLQLFGGETVTTPTLNSGSTVNIIGAGDGATHTYSIPNWSYSNLTINATDGTKDTFNQTTAMSIASAFTLTAGSVANTAGSPVAFTAGSITANGTWTPGNNTNITDSGAFSVASTSAVFTGAGGQLSITGNFSLSSGTFTSVTNIATMSGNFSNTGGTFNHNNGTVQLNGTNQTITGSTTFYNLTKTVNSADTLTFPASSTQTILNTLTLQGASGANLTLVSSSSGTQWKLDPQGTRSIAYLLVSDSDNINATTINAEGTNTVDNGNNTGWTFNPSNAPFTNETVFGQPNFTSNSVNEGNATSSASLDNPNGIAVDANNNVYIVDQSNNRVLYYPVGTTSATRVYGQADFTSNKANRGAGSPTASTLNAPRGITVDQNGGIYIADTGNNRVLHYPSGVTVADTVFGQVDFTHKSANQGLSTPTASTLNTPYKVTLGTSGGIYVSDTNNNRVLHFPSGSTSADIVYGQPDFVSNTANNGGISATSLNLPSGVAVDQSGDVYIIDQFNNRMLFYPAGSTTATIVYGQPNFTSNTLNNGGLGASTLYQPSDVFLDSNGNMYLSDEYNNRVLHFSVDATSEYGAVDSVADAVYGQPDFTHSTVNNGGLSASSLDHPTGVTVDTLGNYYIVDQLNNRALFFPYVAPTSNSTTSGSQNTGSNTVAAIQLAVLENMQQDAHDTLSSINGGNAGLWINWRSGSSPLTANWNGTPTNECTVTNGTPSCTNSPPREDQLTDIRYLHNLYSYKTQNNSTLFDSEIASWSAIIKYQFAGTRNQRGWIYNELIDIGKLSGDSWYTTQADGLVNYYATTLYHSNCGCLYFVSTTHPNGYYRPEDTLLEATAMIQEGERVHNQTWITEGYNAYNFIYSHAFLTSWKIFPFEMDNVLNSDGSINSNETFFISNGTKIGNAVKMGVIAQIAQMEIRTYQATGDTKFQTDAQNILDAMQSNVNTLGMWDTSFQGYCKEADFTGSSYSSPGTPTISCTKKEIGRQIIILQAYHEADINGGLNNKYASMETTMTNLATGVMYYSAGTGYLYEMTQNFSPVVIHGAQAVTEDWVTSEADGAALEALFSLTAPVTSSSTNSTVSSSNSSSSGSPNANCHTGWVYCIDSGPNFLGFLSYISGVGEAFNAFTYISNIAASFDVHVVITKLHPSDLVNAHIPFPWKRGFNSATDFYQFQALSAFNGYPLLQFNRPVTIVLPYDQSRLMGLSPSQLKIAWYNTITKKWTILTAPYVVNSTNNTIATTVKKYGDFVVIYPKTWNLHDLFVNASNV